MSLEQDSGLLAAADHAGDQPAGHPEVPGPMPTGRPEGFGQQLQLSPRLRYLSGGVQRGPGAADYFLFP